MAAIGDVLCTCSGPGPQQVEGRYRSRQAGGFLCEGPIEEKRRHRCLFGHPGAGKVVKVYLLGCLVKTSNTLAAKASSSLTLRKSNKAKTSKYLAKMRRQSVFRPFIRASVLASPLPK